MKGYSSVQCGSQLTSASVRDAFAFGSLLVRDAFAFGSLLVRAPFALRSRVVCALGRKSASNPSLTPREPVWSEDANLPRTICVLFASP